MCIGVKKWNSLRVQLETDKTVMPTPPRQLQGYSAATIMHEEVIRAEAKQAGAETITNSWSSLRLKSTYVQHREQENE